MVVTSKQPGEKELEQFLLIFDLIALNIHLTANRLQQIRVLWSLHVHILTNPVIAASDAGVRRERSDENEAYCTESLHGIEPFEPNHRWTTCDLDSGQSISLAKLSIQIYGWILT